MGHGSNGIPPLRGPTPTDPPLLKMEARTRKNVKEVETLEAATAQAKSCVQYQNEWQAMPLAIRTMREEQRRKKQCECE